MARRIEDWTVESGRNYYDRFWSKASGDCWEWFGARNPAGYGTFALTKRERVMVHRLVWERMVGPIPQGYEIDHLCRNRACVNPDHLEPVTRLENVRRSVASDPRRECSKGHPLTRDNLMLLNHSDGYVRRKCRQCLRARNRRGEKRRLKERRDALAGGEQP